MLSVTCDGSPYNIGLKHGTEAAVLVHRTIAFYADLFWKMNGKTWQQVTEIAAEFEGEIEQRWPRLHTEMNGVAAGSKRSLLEIIAINCRTEIAFGLWSDGCTSLYRKTDKSALLGQNWDWYPAQQENLILLTIRQHGFPMIKMVTEAGLIGKIGLNSAGLGVCFNAIRSQGMDRTRIPVHLGLRLALESNSVAEATQSLKFHGLAASGTMMIGDNNGGIGLEFTKSTVKEVSMDENGAVVHANHMLASHDGFNAPIWLEDSFSRSGRMNDLMHSFGKLGAQQEHERFSGLFLDESGYPGSICRTAKGYSEAQTLFNIVMDLEQKQAVIKVGKPTMPVEIIEVNFYNE